MSGFKLHAFRQTDGVARTVAEVVKVSNAMTALSLRSADGSTETMPDPDKILTPGDAVIACIDGRSGDRTLVKDRVSPRKILIVDDQKALRIQLVRKLRAAGHTLTVA